MASLNADQVLNSAAVVFQDAIDQHQGEGHKFVIALNFLHNLEEQSDVLLSFVFLQMN